MSIYPLAGEVYPFWEEEERPLLRETNTRFRTYTGKRIEVLGETEVTIQKTASESANASRGEAVQVTLVVVEGM